VARTIAIVVLAGLLLVAVAVASVAVWWAKTVVETKDMRIAVERQNVANMRMYAESLHEELQAAREEARRLYAECDRLRAAEPSEESCRE